MKFVCWFFFLLIHRRCSFVWSDFYINDTLALQSGSTGSVLGIVVKCYAELTFMIGKLCNCLCRSNLLGMPMLACVMNKVVASAICMPGSFV